LVSKIRLADGREITVALDGKRVIEELAKTTATGGFTRFTTLSKARVWVNPTHVAAVEDRPDLD
jgi:hypothetical protein